jgi:diguanylate cyclase (GGDEF)-like protein
VTEDVEPLETDPADAPAATGATGVSTPDPASWTDPLTGADGPRLWDRLLASETARCRRYRRPATVALVEFLGFDELVRAWGPAISERTFVRQARTLATEIRSSDHIARIERTRFAILLTETDEIAAINFVERVRTAFERQPGELRIALGWASPTAKTDLHDALSTAEQRLLDEIGDDAAD